MTHANNMNTVLSAVNDAAAVPYMPSGYKVVENTLYKVCGDDMHPISDPLYIEALARDPNGHNWGSLLRWNDQDGRTHRWFLPSQLLAGNDKEYQRVLMDRGWRIRPERQTPQMLRDYILEAKPPRTALLTKKTGWFDGRYVLNDESIYGSTEGEPIILHPAATVAKTDKRGTLASWQQDVARYAVGNSRLGFCISAAFAGVLLRLCDESAGGFHLAGGSSTGKTTALRMAASVWGQPIRSWRTTDNAAESWALGANDGFLPIDELSQADGRSADALAYMLGNGQTKGRSDKEGRAISTSDFQLLFLSTGEIGLNEKLLEDKKVARAGQRVRMVEIPIDAEQGLGGFEELHGFPNADAFSKHLSSMSEKHCGHPIDAFLTYIINAGTAQVTQRVKTLMSDWQKQYLPEDVDGQVSRTARRFALVAAAGELATQAGILPWAEGESFQSAARCFCAWLAARGGTGNHEIEEGIQKIISFIEQHADTHFSDMDKPQNVLTERAGYRRTDKAGDTDYLIFPDFLRTKILDSSRNESTIIKAAIKRGLIKPDSAGKTTASCILPDQGKKRMFCVQPWNYQERQETAP